MTIHCLSKKMPPTLMTSSDSTLFRGTPYLDDLQRQLGDTFTKMVQREVQQFQNQQQNIRTAIEERDEGTKRLKKALKQRPSGLRHTGAYVAGPKTLPRGETVQLPLVVRTTDGRECVVGYFVVHTEIGGAWQMVGYESEGGEPTELDQEVLSYEPDDLERAMGEVSTIMNRVDQMAGAYIQLDEKRTSTSVGAASLVDGDVTPGIENELPLETSTSSAGSSSSSSSSSAAEKFKSNARKVLGVGRRSGETMIRNDNGGKTLSQSEVIKRLKKKNYRDNAPKWFRNIKNKREDDPQTWRKLKRVAKVVFNKMREADDKGDPKTINEFWSILGRACKEQNVVSEDYCWTTHQSINLDRNGRCTKRSGCHRYEAEDNGRKCIHQSVRQ